MARTMDKENIETETTENILKSSGETYVIDETENNLSNSSVDVPTPCASQEFIREHVEISHDAYETMKLRIFASETKTQELENRLKLQDNELELYKLQCSQLQDKLLVAEHETEKWRSLDELSKLNAKTKFLKESIALMSPVASDNLELKKSVTFNQNSLTPEIIDSRFPVSTPVRKGRKPENPKPETPRYDNSNQASVRANLLKKNHLKKSNDEPKLEVTPQKSTQQKNNTAKKSTPHKSTPNKIFNSKPDNLQDSLTVECEEANAALNSLKQKFSERRNLATPETSNELVKTPTLTFDSTGSSGDISTPRRTLNNMQSLSDQMKSIRLEQTPVRAMPNKVGVAVKEVSKPESNESENRKLGDRKSENRESENNEPEMQELKTQESDQEHEIVCKLDYTELKNFENIVDDELGLEAVKADSSELPKIGSSLEIETSPETVPPPAIQPSKSPRIEQTSLEKKIKRISIANQTSQEKEVLERKKSEFLKQQEKKRAASKNNPTTPKKTRSKTGQNTLKDTTKTSPLNTTKNTTVQNIKHSMLPSNNGDSPIVMRPIRHKNTSTTNLSKVTSPSIVTQDRRDRGKAVLDKQKQRMEDTVNPAPQKSRPTSTNSTSRSALQSANSSRLASARSRKEEVPRTGVKNINKNTSHDNKQQIILAIEKTCLPGAVNQKDRKLIMEPLHEKLQDKEVSHLVILFRNAQLKFRSVYRLEPQDQENVDSERVQFTKISGQGPNKLTNTDVKCYYSYQTGRKIFNLINGKTFGFNVAGMLVEDRIWSNFKPKRTEVKK